MNETDESIYSDASDDDNVETVTINNRGVKKRKMYVAKGSKDEDNVLNGIYLHSDFAFGNTSAPIKDNILFLNEDYVAYQCGKHISTYDISNKKMSFINRESSSKITAMTNSLTHKKEMLIAMSEKSLGKELFINVHIPKRMRWIKLGYKSILEKNDEVYIKKLEIPIYSRLCISLIHCEDKKHMIVYHNYEKEKLRKSMLIDKEISSITVPPNNLNEVILSGKRFLRVFNVMEADITESEIRMMPSNYENENDFIDARYMHDCNKLVVISEQNNVFIIEDYKIVSLVKADFVIKEYIRPSHAETTTANTTPKHPTIKGKSPGKLAPPLSTSPSKNKPALDDHFTFTENVEAPVVSCVSTMKNGFVLGSKYKPIVSVYEIDKDNSVLLIDNYSLSDKKSSVNSFSISPDENYLAISTYFDKSNKEFDSTTIIDVQPSSTKMEYYLLKLSQVNAIKPIYSYPLRELFGKNSTTIGPILCISSAVTRNLIASIGEDNYIRVYEHSDNFDQLLTLKCEDASPPLCITIHPMGFQLSVGFKEGIKVYYILEEEIRLAAEYIGKPCFSAKYANGGHLLAAGNGPGVSLIDPYSLELRYHLTGHSAAVKQLDWNESDTYLVSVCTNGSGYGWSTNFEINHNSAVPSNSLKHTTHNNSKIEFIMKNTKFNGIAYDEEYDFTLLATSDNKIHILNEKGINTYSEITSDVVFTSILLSKRLSVLIAGTSIGSVRVYLWPVINTQTEGKDKELEFAEFCIHSSAVTSLAISADYKYLFSSSVDGSIYVLTVKEFVNGMDLSISASFMLNSTTNAGNRGLLTSASSLIFNKRKKQQFQKCKLHALMTPLCLVQKNTISTKKEQINELKYEIQNIKSEIDYEIENKANEYVEKINQLHSSSVKVLDIEKQKYKEMQEKHETKRNKLLKQIEENLESHKNEIDDKNQGYQDKLKYEYKRHDELLAEINTANKKYEDEILSIIEEHKEVLVSIEVEYQTKYDELYQNHMKLLSDIKEDDEKFDIALEQSEQEYEKEIMKRREELQTRLSKLEVAYEELKTVKDSLKRENDKLSKKIEDCEVIEEKVFEERNKFEFKLDQHNKKLSKMQEQLSEREELIKSKEKSIKELRNINSHLENFRFVLDHKITSLKEEKVPMEQQIKNLEGHIKNMYKELLEESTMKRKLLEKLKDSEISLKSTRIEMKNSSDDVTFTKRRLEILHHDLATLLRQTDLHTWPSLIKELYNKHFSEMAIKDDTNEDEGIMESEEKIDENEHMKDELIRQRDWMNKKLQKLVEKNVKVENEKSEIFFRIQNENTRLISECNRLRNGNHEISRKVLLLEKRLKELSGISVNDSKVMDSSLDGFAKKGKKIGKTETPFQIMKKKPVVATRSQILQEYYHQHQSDQYKNSSVFASDDGIQALTGNENQDTYTLNSIIGDFDKNQNAMYQQNVDIQQLQERVHQFLRSPDETNQSSAPILPPINKFMSPRSSSVMNNEAANYTPVKDYGGLDKSKMDNASKSTLSILSSHRVNSTGKNSINESLFTQKSLSKTLTRTSAGNSASTSSILIKKSDKKDKLVPLTTSKKEQRKKL